MDDGITKEYKRKEKENHRMYHNTIEKEKEE